MGYGWMLPILFQILSLSVVLTTGGQVDIQGRKREYEKVHRSKILNLSHSPRCGGTVVQAKIVGGTRVVRGEFPFLVSIKNNGVHFCGGSIISEYFILTAAHCMLNRDLDAISVTVREFDMTETEEDYPGYEVLPQKIIIHAQFILKTYDNDIALIRLQLPLAWDEFTMPVCLPDQRKKILAGRNGILTGWGRLSEVGARSSVPRKLMVPIVDMDACTEVLGKKNVNPTKFCAGFLTGGKDACQGDSGGPLVVQVGNVYLQEGIISSGVGCARQDLYGLYTRISEFIPWIRSAMNETAPEGFDQPFKVSDVYFQAPPGNGPTERKDDVDRDSGHDFRRKVIIAWHGGADDRENSASNPRSYLCSWKWLLLLSVRFLIPF